MPIADYDAFVAAWSATHGNYPAEQSRLVSGWLRCMFALARPLRSLPPTAITFAALVAAAGAAAVSDDGWPLLVAAVLVLLNGLLDGLDGAVAVLSGRASRWGFVVDSVADRIADALLLLAMWRAGAHPAAVLAAAMAIVLLEYTRARSMAAGVSELSSASVGERPVRLAVIALTFVVAAASGHAGTTMTTGASVLAALAAVGWIEVLAQIRPRLR